VKLLKSILLLLAFVWLLAAPRVMAFDLFGNCTTLIKPDGTKTQVCGPCKSNTSAASCRNPGTQNPFVHIIKVAADLIAIATGIAAVVMIIFGGITMITSAGNTEAVTNARRRIIYSVVGLVVVALSWTIVAFTTDRLIK
jgi:hypothetical protein